MSWPEVGKPVARSEAVYAPEAKWDWILAKRGHGSQLRRVFGQITPDEVWEAIIGQTLAVPISRIRDLGSVGRSCEVRAFLALNDRVAAVIIVWHYDDEDADPRLITVYPTT